MGTWHPKCFCGPTDCSLMSNYCPIGPSLLWGLQGWRIRREGLSIKNSLTHMLLQCVRKHVIRRVLIAVGASYCCVYEGDMGRMRVDAVGGWGRRDTAVSERRRGMGRRNRDVVFHYRGMLDSHLQTWASEGHFLCQRENKLQTGGVIYSKQAQA